MMASPASFAPDTSFLSDTKIPDHGLGGILQTDGGDIAIINIGDAHRRRSRGTDGDFTPVHLFAVRVVSRHDRCPILIRGVDEAYRRGGLVRNRDGGDLRRSGRID